MSASKSLKHVGAASLVSDHTSVGAAFSWRRVNTSRLFTDLSEVRHWVSGAISLLIMNARPRIPMQGPECETARSWLDVHSDNVRSRIGALGWIYTASADNVRSRIPSERGLGWTCTVIMWRSCCYFLAMYYENEVMLCCTWSSFLELGQAHYKYMFLYF